MIKHIVMWKLKDFAEGRNKADNALRMKQALENLKLKVPEIVEIEAGIDFNKSEAAFDIVLYSSFKSQEDLLRYQKHPDHQLVADFINKIQVERAVVDYEI